MSNHILLSLSYLAVFFFAQHQVKKWILSQANRKQISEVRSRLVIQLISYLMFFVTVSIMAISLGLGYQEVSLFVSSAFAVLGVALFAQWSILSNITAGVLIFFVFPYRIGDRIRIVEKDEDLSGVIIEISIFHVLIKRDVGDLMTYPNSLMLQKAVIKLNPLPNPPTETQTLENKTIETSAPELSNTRPLK